MTVRFPKITFPPIAEFERRLLTERHEGLKGQKTRTSIEHYEMCLIEALLVANRPIRTPEEAWDVVYFRLVPQPIKGSSLHTNAMQDFSSAVDLVIKRLPA